MCCFPGALVGTGRAMSAAEAVPQQAPVLQALMVALQMAERRRQMGVMEVTRVIEVKAGRLGSRPGEAVAAPVLRRAEILQTSLAGQEPTVGCVSLILPLSIH